MRGSFRKLTQTVFQGLLQQDQVTNVRIQHNVILVGRTEEHQIDVFWEFTQGDIVYTTLISCKDWKNPVKKAQVLEFRAILDDIPGQPRGIIVSRAGFQSGAQNVANAHGILLYTLREPSSEFWNAHLKELHIDLQLLCPVFRNIAFDFDPEWLRSQLGEGTHRLALEPSTATVYENNEPPRTLNEFLTARVSLPNRETPVTNQTVQLQQPAYIEDLGSGTPRLKLRALSLDAGVELYQDTRKAFDNVRFVKFVLRQLGSGDKYVLGEDGSVEKW